MKIYLAGCGKIGKRLGEQLTTDGHHVIGLKRSAAEYAFPIKAINLADRTSVSSLPADADIIVFTVTPSEYSEAGYAHVYDTILDNVLDFAKRHEELPLVILVSSTGVYGQQNGEWVDENSPTEPTSFSGKWILHGENQLRQRLSKTLTVRFSGIYGPSRTRLIQRALSGNPVQKAPPLWTNRIHEDDCVGSLHFLINQFIASNKLEDIYLISDDTPVSSYDISAFICDTMGRPKPPILTQNLSEKYNKRCDNQQIKSLGYTFRHPNYQQGYQEILKNHLIE